MIFSSLDFIIRFLPIFLIAYLLVPAKAKYAVSIRNLILLMGSLFFYAFGEPRYVFLMLASIVANYGFTIYFDLYIGQEAKRRAAFIVSLIFNIGILGFFKYAGFFAGNINRVLYHIGHLLGVSLPHIPVISLTLPVGISFYTFQIMSYVIDVYRGKYEREENILSLGTYITMFPQLIAGPIVKYDKVRDRLKDRSISPVSFDRGVRTFVIGLGAKVIIANQIGSIWTDIQRVGYESISTIYAWLGALAYSFQIYYDFLGYSLMAMGLGLMLGFRFPKNFDNPYLSTSATEFWQRWHITLGAWFREYVYIPLGGNRVGKGRMIFNLLVVWALTGLWHGAEWNFVLWGIGYFVLITIEKLFLKKLLDKYRIIGHLYMVAVILCSWIVFAIPDLGRLLIYISRMFPFIRGSYVSNVNPRDFISCLRTYYYVFFIAFVCLIPFKRLKRLLMSRKIVGTLVVFAIFVVCMYLLCMGLNNPFLYFRF